MATTSLITAEEIERLPEDERFELIRGERREVSPTSGRHGSMQVRLGARLFPWAEAKQSGELYSETGFLITRDPDTLLAPDLAFVRAEHVLPEANQDGFLAQIPDLVVEIVSPSDSHSEVVDKVMTYLRAGVTVVWEVDPRRRRIIVWNNDQTVQELKPGDIVGGGNILPGFQLPVADLFPDQAR